ncbi:MAG: 8-oxoguanine deaminase [Candidatus Rokuibacteriota bacterium]|nr:MAG: 8-oxoguanine deaminase [Candidatus Rokubacteria bacterium]
MSLLLTGAHVVAMDDTGSELEGGWILLSEGLIAAVGASDPPAADERVDLGGALVTPGLVNTHHHLYQTLTRARAQQADLFAWLRELYPLWAGIDAEAEYAAARTGLAELALSGCTTVFDHHYVFPQGCEGLIEAEIDAARELGVRLVASRGSMDLGESQGGLPPDSLVEEIDDVLADTQRLAAFQDDRIRLAVAPCSPFSVTRRLMLESADLARKLGLRLHTHLAETAEEDAYCRELYGCTPVEYLTELGWTAGDVWCAHCVHLSAADVATFGCAGMGVAHCPTSNLRLGAGVAPVRELLDAGVPVGLGVDGSASNERSDLLFDVKQALLVARGRSGPAAMSAREALRLGTRGGAAVLGRDDIGCIEPGKCADLAVWRTDSLAQAGAEDPVAGLVLSAPHRVDRLYVGGEEVVRDGRLVNADEDEIAGSHRLQARRFAA